MIITAYVGVDQWLPMVTFRPDTTPRLELLPVLVILLTGADKYYAKHGSGQLRLRLQSNLQSLEETPISSSLAAIKTESV